MRRFPERFHLALLLESRRARFPEPEDAFQQLVGDWALELDGTAHVSPTKGRDGSIDACMGRDGGRSPLLQGAAFPLIVECKHHDDGLDGLPKNVLEGWRKVADKLRQQAAAGWPDKFAPWRQARGYLYPATGAGAPGKPVE